MSLKEEILKLKKEKNALIVAHLYQCDEIQEIADIVGDSYFLSKKAMESDKDLIILDVREPKDFNNGHLLNAINIPIENIDKRMDELRNYKSKDIIVYCNTGRKSAEVAEKLVEHGFTDVTNIVDGVSEYDFKLVK